MGRVQKTPSHKKLIKKAIDKYDVYSPRQRDVLKLFVDVSINHRVHASVKYISEQTELKKSTIYFAINLFLKDEIIYRDYGASKALMLSKRKLQDILDIYKQKYSMENI